MDKFVNSLVEKIPLFNYEYPSFLPHLIIAIDKHKSLSNYSRDKLASTCDLFELIWKED